MTGRRVSEKMLAARAVVEKSGGAVTAQAAATSCGLTTGALTRDPWYREYMAARGETSQQKARRLVVTEGKSAYEAARLTGLAQSSISRAGWYREYKKELTK